MTFSVLCELALIMRKESGGVGLHAGVPFIMLFFMPALEAVAQVLRGTEELQQVSSSLQALLNFSQQRLEQPGEQGRSHSPLCVPLSHFLSRASLNHG